MSPLNKDNSGMRSMPMFVVVLFCFRLFSSYGLLPDSVTVNVDRERKS